jgi:hypothetical protein
MMSYNKSFFSLFCLPSGKADDTPSPSLPRARSRLLRLHPWTPWIWGILNALDLGHPQLSLNQGDILKKMNI